MNQHKTNALAFILIGIVGIGGSVSGFFIQRHEINELKKQPTYHCDGSETHGFANPGTPEAAACWFEVRK